MMLTEGQMNDHKGTALLLPVLPPAGELLGDRGYDSDGSGKGCATAELSPAFRRPKTGSSRWLTTRSSIGSVIGSRMPSAA